MLSLSPSWTPFPHRTPKRLQRLPLLIQCPPLLQLSPAQWPQTQWSKGTEHYSTVLPAASRCPRRGWGTELMHTGFPISQRRSRESASHGCWAPPTPPCPSQGCWNSPCVAGGGSTLTMQMSCLTPKCLSWPGDPPFESDLSAQVLHPHLLTISSPWTLDSPSVGGRWGRAGRDPAQSSGGFWGLGAWAWACRSRCPHWPATARCPGSGRAASSCPRETKGSHNSSAQVSHPLGCQQGPWSWGS